MAVWDYSAHNIAGYAAKIPPHVPVQCVTPGMAIEKAGARNIPILVYGHLNRRQQVFLAPVRKRFKVAVAEHVFGQPLYDLLGRSKIVLNVHHKEGEAMEAFSVNEALRFGCRVISEAGPDMERYEGIVAFADDADGFMGQIHRALAMPFEPDLKRLDNLNEIKTAAEAIEREIG